jgi:23S rRNA pseudouridine1911/1915/1917 synthase
MSGEFSINDIEILYEDNHLLVVVKPQNMPVAEDESQDADLLNVLKAYIKEKYNKPGNAFLGLVHRLDRPTGGVMMFAKTSKAAARLSEAIRDGDVEKNYLAVINGKLNEERGALVNYLKKDPVANSVSVVPQLSEGAKRAELKFRQLETKSVISLVQVSLVTGRSHQIRAQMAAQGCPIFGDKKYGDKLSSGSNLALWAYELKFIHPVTGERLVFVAYPPETKEPWKKFELKQYIEKFFY